MPETGALAWKKSLLGTKTKRKQRSLVLLELIYRRGFGCFFGFIYLFVSLFFWNCVQIEYRGHYFHP